MSKGNINKIDLDDLLYSLHSTAKNSAQGITGIASITGQRPQTLVNRLNPNDESHQPTLADFVMVVYQSDDITPIELLCEMFGGRFVARSNEKASSVYAGVLHAVAEGGDVAKAVETALADGEITTTERANINREISEAITSLNKLRNTINEAK